MHDSNSCVEIKEAVVKGENKRREMVGEKDSQRRRMALNETTETVRLSGRSRCAISPPVWREPNRAKRELRGSLDRRKKAKWKRQTFLSVNFLYKSNLSRSCKMGKVGGRC